MPLCVNQSGTWRCASRGCINQAGTWRCITAGCINVSGTWRCFGFTPPPPTVSLTASSTQVAQNSTVTLTWSSTNATSVTSNFGASAVSGSTNVTALTGTNYTITVTGGGGQASANRLVKVTLGGGFVVCRAANVNWIVAPVAAEVKRTWYLRNDANTRAQQVTGQSGWFVPSQSQLQNPGYACRTFWDSVGGGRYWSNTQISSCLACCLTFGNGGSGNYRMHYTLYVRSFRCITY